MTTAMAAGAAAALRPHESYKDSGVSWLPSIPETWSMQRNGRLFAQRNETGRPELPVLEVSLRTGVRVRDFAAGVRKQVMDDRAKYKVGHAGDVAYNMMRMWQGAVGVVPVDGLVSPAYVVARAFDPSAVSYFDLVFRTPAYMREVENWSRGIVPDRNRLYWEAFKQIQTPVPPPEEQRAIIRLIEHVDRQVRRYVAAKTKMIALLNEHKQAIIRGAVTRGLDPSVRLTPSGVEWLGDVPEHWNLMKVGRFAKVGNGSTPARSNSRYWREGDVPWLNSASVNANPVRPASQFVTEQALRECHLPIVQPNSVLVAITGQGKTRGTAAVLTYEATINQHMAYITPRSHASAEYLQYFLTAAYAELRRISVNSGSTKGALTCADVAAFKVLVPPIDEQKKIVAFLRQQLASTETGISSIQHLAERMQEFRARLIADVVSGKLDVREAAAHLPEEIEDATDTDELIADETDKDVETGEEEEALA